METINARMREAIREELVDLWTDLDNAIRSSVNRRWSMGCDWILERIDLLSPFLLEPIDRDEMPHTIVHLFDLYHRTIVYVAPGVERERDSVLAMLPDPPPKPTRRVGLDQFLDEERSAP